MRFRESVYLLQKYNTVRYFIELSYFGKNYHGWQRQPNASSVQQTIESALSTILRQPLEIMGAGRTDAGVHATQMFAHFDYQKEPILTKDELDTLTHKLNSFLPKDIAIHRIFEVSSDSHTRFDATSRSYLYRISTSKNPFTTEQAYLLKYDIDLKKMNEAAQILLSYKDFECFSKSKTEVNTYLCDITLAEWKKVNQEYHFHISANRFLRNMVRAIVGTLLEIGQGKKPVSWMHDVITGKSRSQAGTSVPGHGLYLTAIEYPETIYKK